MTFDVIVVGLGGMGSAAAAHLAGRGLRVAGFERFGPAHALGSSHGGSRIIRQSYFEHPAYVPLLKRAYELWERVERDTGADLLTLTGGLYLGRPEYRTVAGALESARQHDLPHELLDAADVRRRFPTLQPEDGEVALYEAVAGFVRPEASVSAHLELAARAGAELHFEEPVQSWQADDDGVRVRTATGSYEAGRLVICPGAWAPQLLADLGVPFTVERQLLYWFQPTAGTAPYERQPIWIHHADDGLQLYGFPAIDGPAGGVKVSFFRHGNVTTPETIDRVVHDDEVAFMAGRLGAFAPGMPGEFLRGAACMYTTTPDEHFVVAVHPAHENVTVACGFSGHGFKFVPVIGEIVADLATTGTTAHPIELFDLRRRALSR